MAMTRKNWIAVASAEHARRGRDDPIGGFMQVGHGKLAPLKRVSAGDRVAYYSPTTELGRADKLQSFVSIGVVHGHTPYEADMGDGFVPWRRNVRYAEAHEAPILPLIDQFNFVEDPTQWGYKFRFGLFEVDEHDIRLIAGAMNADIQALEF
jgi:EVE domain